MTSTSPSARKGRVRPEFAKVRKNLKRLEKVAKQI